MYIPQIYCQLQKAKIEKDKKLPKNTKYFVTLKI